MRYESIRRLLNIGLAMFGAWVLYAQINVISRFDFNTLRTFSFIPVLIFPLLLLVFQPVPCFSRGGSENPDAPGDRHGLPLWYGVSAPFVLVMLFEITGSIWLFWVLAVAHLTLMAFAAPSSPAICPEDNPQITSRELVVVACVCAVAALITLGANRPDMDDAYFLNVAVSAVDFPKNPVLLFDSMHKSGLAPVEQNVHFLQVYELFVAFLASITGLSVSNVYYVVLPAVFAALLVVVHWVVLRYFLPGRSALFAVIAVAVLFVFWGDGHRTFGNFAFVRLYQGKAVFLVVVLPMIVYAAFRYRVNPTWRNWLYLMLHQLAGVGFTTNALVLAPIAAGFALAARPRATASYWRTMVTGLSTVLPIVMLQLVMYSRLSLYGGSLDLEPVLTGYQTVLGAERAGLVLLALLLLPALASQIRLRHAAWLSGYLWLAFLVVFFPATPDIVASLFAHIFSWRIFWTVPVPLLISLTIGILAGEFLPRRRLRVGLLGLGFAAFILLGNSAVSGRNWSWSNIGRPKVDREMYEVAQKVMAIDPPGGLVIAPETVTTVLSGFHNAPPMVGVRKLYLRKMCGIVPDDDLDRRYTLLAYIEGDINSISAAQAVQAIEMLHCKTVVFSKEHRDARILMDLLPRHGFMLTEYFDFILAVRDD